MCTDTVYGNGEAAAGTEFGVGIQDVSQVLAVNLENTKPQEKTLTAFIHSKEL